MEQDMMVKRVEVTNDGRTMRDVIEAAGIKIVNEPAFGKPLEDTGVALNHGDIEICFFHLNHDGRIDDAELEKQYGLHKLKPVHPYPLALLNAAEPEFMDEYRNGTHWQDAEVMQHCWYRAAFYRFGGDDGERQAYINPCDNGWDDRYWFGGIRI